MQRRWRHIFTVGLLGMLLLGSCTEENDDDSPTTVQDAPSPSDVVILVDKNHDNATSVPCGTEDAVCASITDGLFSAAAFQDGIPTVLVRPGTYDTEPTYPIKILLPVILKAEQANEAIIAPDGAFVIESPDVTIEGFVLASQSFEPIQVMNGGHVVLKNSIVKEPEQDFSSRRCASVVVYNGATAVIDGSELYGVVASEGILTVNDSVLSTVCPGGVLDISRSDDDTTIGTLKDNTLYGAVQVSIGWEREAQVTFEGNMIDGQLRLWGGKAFLKDNTITEGIRVSADATINLDNNRIEACEDHPNSQYAFYSEGFATARLSHNRFDSKKDGINMIVCEEGAQIHTDSTNTLLNPNCWVACNGLPIAPGTEPF